MSAGYLSRRIGRTTADGDEQSTPTGESDSNILQKDTQNDGDGDRAGLVSGGHEERHMDNLSNQHNGTRPKNDLEGGSRTIGIRDRVGCFTWTWFTMTMATGGIANVLNSIPFRSEWLRIIGVIILVFNLVLFSINCVVITLRFRWNPGSFRESFTSPSESLFVPACIVTVGTIFVNVCQYGIPYMGVWLQTTMQVCFWGYVALSFISSSGIYLIIWSTQVMPIRSMTPIWIFPAYPLLLTGPFAANLIQALPDAASAARINSIAIALGAVCIQGTGFLVSLMIYSAFIYRLMTQKLPHGAIRPGMFVSVGPSGFTVAGIVLLGSSLATKIIPNGYQGIPGSAMFLKLLTDFTGLWLWGLCLWFCVVSIGAHWQLFRPNHPENHIKFDMTWFSFVFPNTALVTATNAIGNALESHAIKILGTIFACVVIVIWITVFAIMIRAIITKRILWPEELDGAELHRRKWMERPRAIGKTERRGVSQSPSSGDIGSPS